MEKAENMSNEWFTEEEGIEEVEEQVFGGNSESPFMQGYSVQDAKITMAKLLTNSKTKTQYIEIDFINKEEKTHREKFMLRGKDGNTYFTKAGKKMQHFGINKVKSLIKVSGLYPDVDAKKLMGTLFSNTEEADVTWSEYGKEKTEEFTIFPDMIGKRVKLCITSKKVNATTSKDQDDSEDQKYVKQCIKDTASYIKANPKKKSLAKFLKGNALEYPNVYKYFTETSVSHFCTLDGLFAGEMASQEGTKMQDFIDANDNGLIFEARTLICDEMTEAQLKKLGINAWGKRVVVDEDTGDYEEPEETEAEEETEEDWD